MAQQTDGIVSFKAGPIHLFPRGQVRRFLNRLEMEARSKDVTLEWKEQKGWVSSEFVVRAEGPRDKLRDLNFVIGCEASGYRRYRFV